MEESIKKQTISGMIWKLMERIGAQVVSLVVSIIIARILDPSDYSVVSLVTIFFAFANILISGGFNAALIQKKNADSEDYSTVLWFSLLTAGLLYVVFFCLAPTISRCYSKPILIPVTRVMALSLPIMAVKSIWCAYISSNLWFKKFFFSTLIGTVISAFVGIILAIKGAGAWALVAQQMTNTIIDTLILVVGTRIGIKFIFSTVKFKSLFSYGWKILVSSLIGTTYSEIVPLVIGTRYSASDLSYYTKGRSFPNLISSTTTNTLSAVMFPAMAKIQDDREKLLQYTRLFIQVASYTTFPLMLGFYAVSDNFISVVLTDKWLPSAPYVRIFCLASMFDMIHIGNCETIKAMGKSGVFLAMEIIKKTGYFCTISLFLIFTSDPVNLAQAFLVCTMIALVVNSIPNQKLLGYRFSLQISDMLPNLIISLLMMLAVKLLGNLSLEKTMLLILQISGGALSYVLLSIATKNSSFRYILGMTQELFREQHKQE